MKIPVTFFRPSGKFYTTEDVDVPPPGSRDLPVDRFRSALLNYLMETSTEPGHLRFSDFSAVVMASDAIDGDGRTIPFPMMVEVAALAELKARRDCVVCAGTRKRQREGGSDGPCYACKEAA